MAELGCAISQHGKGVAGHGVMSGFSHLLQRNRNYRYTWIGQIVSEAGDHFNNVAVLSLAVAETHNGAIIAGIMLSRAIPAVMAGPLAGVLLDRFDRRRIMIASDLIRAVIALGFILAISYKQIWLLYLLSALLMLASPFFTSGRSAILPAITTESELHTANSLTQTTGWMTLAAGAFLGGTTVARFGYQLAFVFNSLSFLFSAFCIAQLRSPLGHFRAEKRAARETNIGRPWHDYRDGLRYMAATPLILGIGLIAVGWASGGGAAQVLFTLFSEMVFNRGPKGLGQLWATAGVGLLIGGFIGNRIGKTIGFENYKKTVFFCYVLHGGAYIVFSQMRAWGWALFFMGLSRAAVAVSSVLNWSNLLRHVDDQYRGRVFSTIETMSWSTMMLSMLGAGTASRYFSVRTLGAASGALSSSTALFWGWANWTGKLPEPARTADTEVVEIHSDRMS
ncbi:MAG: MFS transporter [Acidobacteriaceae bacterium]|nr:MFS transporter [Acidobacteriaceae bacterium]MBV9780560.1 MFS transporter [Acidobacteriaceae bacterium]